MSYRFRTARLMCLGLVLAVLTGFSISLQQGMAEPLSSPQYYATAAVKLPKGTILTKSNTKMIAASDSDKIPRGAMWLTEPNDAYGFALERAVDAGSFIGGHDLKVSSRDFVPRPDDLLWKKYAKSSIVCDQRLDFKTSQKYDQGALAELVKMGVNKQRLVRMDEHDLIFNMLQHTKQHEAEMKTSSDESKRIAAESRNRQPFNLANAAELEKKYAAEVSQIEAKILNEARTRLSRAQAVYKAVVPVLPPGCQVVRFQKDELADAQKRYAEVLKK